jgi:pre-mRNA-splicing factor ATP-dependent RNA helicase DHX15/PRP43
MRPYTQRYYDILSTRKTLPVWEQKEDFIAKVHDNQVVILVGETGSGKTTQVCNEASSLSVMFRCWL